MSDMVVLVRDIFVLLFNDKILISFDIRDVVFLNYILSVLFGL